MVAAWTPTGHPCPETENMARVGNNPAGGGLAISLLEPAGPRLDSISGHLGNDPKPQTTTPLALTVHVVVFLLLL